MIIAIDGVSGTGKSTVARQVAKRLGIAFFDTGAMYRCFAWTALQGEGALTDSKYVESCLPSFAFRVQTEGGSYRYFVGEEELTDRIRSQEVAAAASQIAVYPQVRKALVKLQRQFGRACDAVFEGRDMGTVVFPRADVKIFLTARAEIRASRRYKELLLKFPDPEGSLSPQQILQEMQQRDEVDQTRKISPLKKAEDAYEIDTSDLSIDQVVQRILEVHRARLGRRFAKMKGSYWVVYWMARIFFRVFFRLKIHGLEHFSRGQGILIANHCSLYDPPVLSISCPEEVHFLAKQSLFRVPVLGRLIRLLNSHPVARGASDAQTFRFILSLLEKGKKIILFPEGNRSEDGGLQPFEKGLAFLVQKAKCPIFPAYLEGTYAAWPRRRRLPKVWGRMRCVFGSPILWEEFEHLEKKELKEAITARAEKSIQELKVWLENGAQGPIP